jgi:hypothetical protein
VLILPSLSLRAVGYWGCYGAAAQFGRKAEDPEPGRCRRTDGKKWRCSREAHGDSKYCEKHIHRGKNRSRKPVEPATAAYLPSALSISPPAPDAPPPAYSYATSPLQLHLDAGGGYRAAPSYHRYAHHAYGSTSSSLFPGGYGPSFRQELQDAELRRQRCLALGADLSLDKPAPAAENKPLRRFFDEWNGGVDDARTQLSISMPSASPSYHNGKENGARPRSACKKEKIQPFESFLHARSLCPLILSLFRSAGE